ncbi:hypothetical protein BGX21_000577 [Mortierella sp. AD011]|nr:hypothetical protein BGX20_000329 [Mortierella sp. AD010]KAF9403698.1 hypothetical protein BGX21_000577 [Mortierella sp. AD011]
MVQVKMLRLRVLIQMLSFVQRLVNEPKYIELAVTDNQASPLTGSRDIISTCAILSSLALNSVKISEDQASTFWVACSILESLAPKRATLNVSINCKDRKEIESLLPRLKNLG